MRSTPPRLRRKAKDPESSGTAPHSDEATRDKPDRVVVCAACGHEIARVDDRTEIAGRHHHTCVNPAGYVYRIACFRRAAGVIGTGEWSDHHTWFAGYWWQIGCCGRCSVHLGWAFQGDGDDFHGLIAERIEERDSSSEQGSG